MQPIGCALFPLSSPNVPWEPVTDRQDRHRSFSPNADQRTSRRLQCHTGPIPFQMQIISGADAVTCSDVGKRPICSPSVPQTAGARI